jgi:hypothetical protein
MAASIFLGSFAPPALPGLFATMNPLTPARLRLSARQVSLLHVLGLPAIPPPTTWLLRRSLSHVTLQRRRLPDRSDLGFAIRRQARQTTRPNRVHLRCGLAIRLPMLSTPPRGDAVSVGYKPENVYLERTCTPLSKHTHRRTFSSLCDPGWRQPSLPASCFAQIAEIWGYPLMARREPRTPVPSD